MLRMSAKRCERFRSGDSVAAQGPERVLQAIDLFRAARGPLLVGRDFDLALRLELLPVGLDGLDLFLDGVELAREVLLVALRLERHARHALHLRTKSRLAYLRLRRHLLVIGRRRGLLRLGFSEKLAEVGLRHLEDADDGVPLRGFLSEDLLQHIHRRVDDLHRVAVLRDHLHRICLLLLAKQSGVAHSLLEVAQLLRDFRWVISAMLAWRASSRPESLFTSAPFFSRDFFVLPISSVQKLWWSAASAASFSSLVIMSCTMVFTLS